MDYTVQSGDTMYFIARKFSINLDVLLTANPKIQNPDLIYPGQVINVPVSGGMNVEQPGIAGEKPLSFISASLNSGGEVQGSAEIPTNPRFTLRFNKNVVNESVWENNKKSFNLVTMNNAAVPISVTRIEDTVDFSQRQNIFIQPLAPLMPGATYNLKILPGLKSKAGETLGQGITVTFKVKGQALG